ncbi:MAG: cytochrome b [Mariprofundales bacterium]
MQILNTHNSYGLFSVLLHWLMAVVILALFSLGVWMVELDYYDSWYHKAPDLHKSIGILLFFVLLLRMAWRWWSITPAHLSNHKWWEIIIAAIVHIALYLLMFAVIFSGYFIPVANGVGVAVFDLFTIPAWVLPIEKQEDVAGIVHFYLAWGLLILAAMHAAAAFKHHVLDKDDTMRRMTFGSVQDIDVVDKGDK